MSRLFSATVGACVLLTLWTLTGCGDESPPEDEHSSADTVSTASDTSTADTATTAREEKDPQPVPNPPPGPAPETSHVRATVSSCDTTATSPQCRIEIRQVLGYGSSTPPLGTGERIVRLPRHLDTLSAAGPHLLVLRHAGDQPAMGEESSGENRLEWAIQSVEEP